jgi:hypothetical protein
MTEKTLAAIGSAYLLATVVVGSLLTGAYASYLLSSITPGRPWAEHGFLHYIGSFLG